MNVLKKLNNNKNNKGNTNKKNNNNDNNNNNNSIKEKFGLANFFGSFIRKFAKRNNEKSHQIYFEEKLDQMNFNCLSKEIEEKGKLII
jgi:hypothetical protein